MKQGLDGQEGGSSTMKTPHRGARWVGRLLLASGVMCPLLLGAANASAATAPMSTQKMAPVTNAPSASCLLGHWKLDLEVFEVDGKPFMSGGRGSAVTFGKGSGFSATGPLTFSVNYNGSSDLVFAEGIIHTRVRGTASGVVRLKKNILVPAGAVADHTVTQEELGDSGKWVTESPTAHPSTKLPPSVTSFGGFEVVCNTGSMVLRDVFTAVESGKSSSVEISWTLFRL